MPKRNQPNLFDDVGALPPPPPDLVALGARVPPNVRFGTSTWTYDGWTGDVYHRPYRSAQPARLCSSFRRCEGMISPSRPNGRTSSTPSCGDCLATSATQWSCGTGSS